MADRGTTEVGFIGLGLMGSAIAGRLAAEHRLRVWNRTPARAAPVVAAGAVLATSARDVFRSCRTVIVMVSDARAITEILDGAHDDVAGVTLVQMSTIAPHESVALARRIARAGGRYVEAPVSGSRAPALRGELIGMLAGEAAAVEEAAAVLAPACARIVRCGAPPSATLMKLAVNTFLITLVTGLAEAFHFADAHDLPRAELEEILDAGPMASFVSRGKARAIVTGDFTPHAAIADVRKNAELVVAAAQRRGIVAPLVHASAQLYAEADDAGYGGSDMAAVITAICARSARVRQDGS